VIEYQRQILLVRNTYGSGLWSFPGGGVKAKELPIDAAIRETSEEVGIALTSVDKIEELSFDANGHHDFIHVFHAVVHGVDFNIDPDEILEAKWFSLNEIQFEKLTAVGLKIFEAFQRSKTRS
jgi:8-oxo-dGTP pyrophosphatase MutT (NUDIX family)